MSKVGLNPKDLLARVVIQGLGNVGMYTGLIIQKEGESRLLELLNTKEVLFRKTELIFKAAIGLRRSNNNSILSFRVHDAAGS